MKFIYFLLVQTIVLANIHSQNLITTYADLETVKFKQEYVYNEQNQLIETIRSTYYKEEKLNVYSSKIEWIYENNKLVKKIDYKFSFDSNDWIKRLEYEINYDGDGCIDSQMQKHYSSTGVRESWITMVNEYDCSDEWKHYRDHSFHAHLSTENIITRKRTDTSEIEIYEAYDSLGGELVQDGMEERKYNQKGNLVEFFRLLPFYGYADKTVYNYDETGDTLLSVRNYHKNESDSPWREFSHWEYFYEDNLLRKIKFGDTRENIFEYYCDGLLKKMTSIWRDSVTRIATYEYDQKVNCPLKCDQLENLSIEIYPNPVKDMFYIESEIFQKEASTVLIYDTTGRLLYQQEIKDRVPNIQVQLSSGINLSQMFIVHLISEGGLSISKIGYLGN